MIAIIDYGAGNLMSVKKALDYIGAKNVITSDSKEVLSASHVILPGVGSFGNAMQSMNGKGLSQTVKEAACSGKPFLGICLGLQLLFKHSDESPDSSGLGILDGQISQLPKNIGVKVPHIGWNSVNINKNSTLFRGIAQGTYFYFVHSFYLNGARGSEVAATTYYGVEIQCAVEKNNLFATQFHPEKSGKAGLQLLKNFVETEG